MDPRFFLLTLPSSIALGWLVAHSVRTLPPRRAAAFWIGCAAYGVLRGIGVRWIVERGLGGAVPYEIRDPLFEILGVSIQEVVGWTIVAYLGWWLGFRFAAGLARAQTAPLFPQVAWCLLWLGAISWAVESTAVAAGWWFWRLPVPGGILGRVPFIGLVDWGFVALDFLLPFLALTRRRTGLWPFATLLLFPLHFGGHLFTSRIGEIVPLPVFHAIHWLLLAALLGLAVGSKIADAAFAGETRIGTRLALAGLATVLVDLLAVQLWLGRFDLLPSLAPAVTVGLVALRPRLAAATAGVAALLALVHPGFVLSAIAPVAALVLRRARTAPRWAATAAVAATLVAALCVHHVGARRERSLIAGLDRALAARDRGELEASVERLRELNRPRARSHTAFVLEGEILYRLGRLDEARHAFQAAVEIKHDLTPARRYLAVIDLQRGDRDQARREAETGLEHAPADLELRYLRRRADGPADDGLWTAIVEAGPQAVSALAALAFEVEDPTGAARLLDLGLERWPTDERLRLQRERIEAAAGRPSR